MSTLPAKAFFNLVDEPWIPVTGKGPSSLRDIFSIPGLPALGGNPIQKIALTKLLLAIGQAASTPEDTKALNNLDVETFRSSCLEYLEKWHDRFWLHGEKPFLQMPVILDWIDTRKTKELHKAKNAADFRLAEKKALPNSIGPGFYPNLPSENDSILTQHQTGEINSDAEKALFIVSIMNFAFGGTQIEKKLFPSSSSAKGKGKPAKPGPSLGRKGYLHTFIQGPTICDTLILNLLSEEDIRSNPYWKTGLGTPPWENMPTSKDCLTALRLKNSYMATLISLSRFVLLYDFGIYYVDGIAYPNHKDGWREPSLTISLQKSSPQIILTDPALRPWREITSILAVFGDQENQGFVCQFIQYGLRRAPKRHKILSIWSGGIRVTNEYGEQFVKKSDDFVESTVTIDSAMWDSTWYDHLLIEMKALKSLEKTIKAATIRYYDSFEPMSDKRPKNRLGTLFASRAVELYWQLAEKNFQDLVDACYDTDLLPTLRKSMGSTVFKVFDVFCPKQTVRQIDAWANSRPNLSKYLSNN